MGNLRSSFFVAIVTLFVLTAYAQSVLGNCCAHEERPTQSEKSEPGPGAAHEDDCQCLCHQAAFHLSVEQPRVMVWVVAAELNAHPDEFPPDAVPVGIEVPPQLA